MTDYVGRKTTLPAHMQAFGNLSAFVDTVSITAALTTNDKVKAVRIPAGTMLTGLEFFSGDLDTGTGVLAVKIGWESASGESITVQTPAGNASAASDDDAFGTALTDFATASSLGGTRKRLAFEPILFNDDVFITIIPTTGANAMSAAKTVTTIAEGITVGIK
jgi:hypothetical protein